MSGEVVVILTPLGPGAAAARDIAYDDTVTQFGVTNLQGAIEALFALIQGGGGGGGGQLDFSNPDNSDLTGH